MQKITIIILTIALLCCAWFLNLSQQKVKSLENPEVEESLPVSEIKVKEINEVKKESIEPKYENISKFDVPLRTLERFKKSRQFQPESTEVPSDKELESRLLEREKRDTVRKKILLSKIKKDQSLFKKWIIKNTERHKDNDEFINKFELLIKNYKETGRLDFDECTLYL